MDEETRAEIEAIVQGRISERMPAFVRGILRSMHEAGDAPWQMNPGPTETQVMEMINVKVDGHVHQLERAEIAKIAEGVMSDAIEVGHWQLRPESATLVVPESLKERAEGIGRVEEIEREFEKMQEEGNPEREERIRSGYRKILGELPDNDDFWQRLRPSEPEGTNAAMEWLEILGRNIRAGDFPKAKTAISVLETLVLGMDGLK